MTKYRILFLITLLFTSFHSKAKGLQLTGKKNSKMENTKNHLATFGGGCFWCTEAVFQMIKGVDEVVSGYAGGHTDKPKYRDIVQGNTGHAEAIQISFDPEIISYKELLEIFFYMHDPTTLNRQGNDVGTQYRSIILYHDLNQKKSAEESINKFNNNGLYLGQIVTELQEYKEFFTAEKYHQDYYKNNKQQPYCSFVISPKIKKLKEKFKNKLK